MQGRLAAEPKRRPAAMATTPAATGVSPVASERWLELACSSFPGLLRVDDLDFRLVGVAAQLGGVHGVADGGQGAELAGRLGTQAVGNAVPTAGQRANEERNAVVAQLHVRAQAVAVVAAADFDRLQARRLAVL